VAGELIPALAAVVVGLPRGALLKPIGMTDGNARGSEARRDERRDARARLDGAVRSLTVSPGRLWRGGVNASAAISQMLRLLVAGGRLTARRSSTAVVGAMMSSQTIARPWLDAGRNFATYGWLVSS